MDGERLRQFPAHRRDRPDRDPPAERFHAFRNAFWKRAAEN
jgi:hypothetical protein